MGKIPLAILVVALAFYTFVSINDINPNNMRQFLSIIAVLFISTISVFAQSTKVEEPQFNPHWYMQIQGGAGHTLGEADFGKLISPAAALSVGRNFTPVWGLRIGVSGWEGKGAWFTPSQVYKFNFMQVNADVTVDVANWLGGFKYDRLINPYVFLGVGGNIAFSNGEAKRINDAGNTLTLLWTGNKAFVAGRAGVGANVRLSDRVLIGLEMNTNMLADKFNSKKADNLDWQMNALVGLTFRFGKNYKKPAFVPVVALPQQAAEAPKVEEPVKVVETPADTPKTEVVPTPEPAKQPVPVVRKDAPAPPSPDTYKMRQDIFFPINSSEVVAAENSKIEALANCLKENPQARVSVVGYADLQTGTPVGNYWLSGWRAIHVRDALKSFGIPLSRVDVDFKGDKEQPYSDVTDNRVAICIIR